MTVPGQEQHTLTANAITNLLDRRFAVIHLLKAPDGTPHGGARLLVVVDGQESRLNVHVGETFAVGDETWRLDGVAMPEDRRFTATISRVEQVA